MESEKKNTKWVVEKKITVGNLISMAVIVAIGTAAYFNIDKRLSLTEKELMIHKKSQDRIIDSMVDDIKYLVRRANENK